MTEEKSDLVQLGQHLSSEAIAEIMGCLIERFESKKDLAEQIGCSYPAVKKWTQGQDPGQKYLPEILSIALNRAPEVRKIIALELFKFRYLGKRLGAIKGFKSATAEYFSRLDKESVKILHYLERQRFAHIDDLADYLGLANHSEILTRIKEVINAQSESFFGGPAMEFRTSALDQRSGRTITFCWWLTRIGMEIMKPGTEKDRVEVFQDEQEVSFLYNMGTRNFSCPNSEASFNHGVLAVKVTSEKAVDQV